MFYQFLEMYSKVLFYVMAVMSMIVLSFSLVEGSAALR